MASSHGAKHNDSAQDPLVYPGWDKAEDHTTQPAVMDSIIPPRQNIPEKESSTTGTTNSVPYTHFSSSLSQMACLGKILRGLVERSNLSTSFRQ